ncbi:MAG: hypothetical protein QXE31_01235 [Candidatus Woesearchaeota archaeon]
MMKFKMEKLTSASKRLWIKDVLNSTTVKKENLPSFVLTNYGAFYKIFLMGVIVSLDENGFLIDDGSGNILVRFFDKKKDIFNLGDIVLVIGRVKEFNNDKYITGDIVKKVNRIWFDLHREILKIQAKEKIDLPIEKNVIDEEIKLGPYQKILNAIAVLDKGDGVDINEIIEFINISNSDEIINTLIEEGEVFEISPGRIKLLN